MKTLLYYTCIVSCFVMIACNTHNPFADKKADSMSRFKWMLGKWLQVNGPDTIVEEWGVLNDTTYLGSAVMTRNGDTVYVEHVQLIAVDTNYFYIPSIEMKNKKPPSVFKLNGSEPKVFSFENQLHDFPQRIVYQLINQDSIFAFIDGMDQGTFSKIEFPMKKMK